MPKPRITPALPLLAAALVAVSPTPAFAYMGAGAGLSMIGSMLSFLGVFLLMIIGFLWYPLKRMIKRKRGGNEAAKEQADT